MVCHLLKRTARHKSTNGAWKRHDAMINSSYIYTRDIQHYSNAVFSKPSSEMNTSHKSSGYIEHTATNTHDRAERKLSRDLNIQPQLRARYTWKHFLSEIHIKVHRLGSLRITETDALKPC